MGSIDTGWIVLYLQAMRLKSLEIKGFKSFANETLIHFNEKVTGIVGPNGSGKSNVIDAIRWVLGEQKTSELRLDQMSSVIFNGTKKRKAANVARVAITFENDKGLLPMEFQTLTVSRTLYRSGNSEYRINDVACRLKDITSLLMETGIGSDTYAIIALGMVDDILSDRDQARRRMMEQAAGVVKFKNRKRETLQKLKGTREDLNRVEDLLVEIEDNLKSLEKQAKRTAKYFEIRDEYKQLSLQMAAAKWHQLQSKKTSLAQTITQETDLYQGKEVVYRTLEAEVEALKNALLAEEQALHARQKDLSAFIQQLRSKENEKQMLLQRAEMLQSNEQNLHNQASQAEQSIAFIQVTIENQTQRIEQQATVCAAQAKLLDGAELTLQEKRSVYANMKSELSEALEQQKTEEKQIFALEKELAVSQNLLDKHLTDIQQDEAFIKQVDDDMRGLETQIQQQTLDVNEKRTLLEQLERREEKRQSDLVETDTLIKGLNKDIDSLKRQIASAQHEFDLTKSMVENLEGFPESIRFLSKQKDWLQHAVLFSDILYCDDEYRIAIENYLEPWLNHFIVPDRKTALEGIRTLSQSQKGKANFLVLNAFPAMASDDRAFPEFVAATKVVQSDPLYQTLMDHFLRNVYIVDQEVAEDENVLLRADQEDIVLLSRSGGLLYQKRNVSGGSIGLFEGKKIGRKKNLEKLEQSIKTFKGQLMQLDKDLAKLEDQRKTLLATNYQSQIQQYRRESSLLETQLAQILAKKESLQERKISAEQKSQRLVHEIAELEQKMAVGKKTLESLQHSLKIIQKKIESQSSISQSVADELAEESQAFNQLKIQTIQQSNLLDNLQRDLTYQQGELERLTQEAGRATKGLSAIGQELRENKQKTDALAAEIVALLEAKQSSEQVVGSQEQAYYQQKLEIQKKEQQIRAVNHELMQAQQLINQLKEKANDLKFALSGLEERIKIEFETNLGEYASERSQDDNVEATESLEIQIDKLRSRIQNYGEINPLAVEAYNEIKQRFDQISTQRNDILAAEASLLQTIKEVEETARARFMEAFEQIRVHFVEVFRSLFTEDDFCDIYLENPDDPLESPIQIIARPKGKKPQTLAQLSGGEKTLTATALLFSFYLLKPAPFCIFDEVDAPLDDANIEKFNNIIQHFSDNSQFIVVTHNKGTMASVDVIYGVYMEEQGVSGLSPVDFRKFQHSGLMETVG